jgi:hypothetical protein
MHNLAGFKFLWKLGCYILILVIFKLKCNNLILNEIVILNASYVCSHVFSLHQKSPDSDPERRTPHFWDDSVALTLHATTSTAGDVRGRWWERKQMNVVHVICLHASICPCWLFSPSQIGLAWHNINIDYGPRWLIKSSCTLAWPHNSLGTHVMTTLRFRGPRWPSANCWGTYGVFY